MTNDRLANATDACREYARNVGADRPDSPYILTDYDTWEPNPFYAGPPCIASVHPEDSDPSEFLDLHSECRHDRRCLHGFGAPVYGPTRTTRAASARTTIFRSEAP